MAKNVKGSRFHPPRISGIQKQMREREANKKKEEAKRKKTESKSIRELFKGYN